MNKKQALIFSAIILAGLGISVYSLNIFGDKVEDKETPDPAPTVDTSTDDKPPAPDPTPTPDPAPKPEKPDKPGKPETPAPTPGAEEKAYHSPEALVGAVAEMIRKRDIKGFLAIAGDKAISAAIRPQLEGLLRDPSWVPHPDTPFSHLAKSADSDRWVIRLQNSQPVPGSDAKGPRITEIYADIAADAEDKSIWRIRKISLPFDFAEKTGLAPGPAGGTMKPGETPGTPGAPSTPGTNPGGGSAPLPKPGGAGDSADALTVAHAFSKALIGRDFELARKLTDPKQVTDERVAALMIALEEGSFHLRADKPLIVTLSRDDLTWVLTRIESGSSASEFAIEMGKPGAVAAGWKIHGITFSKLIAALASQAGAGGVAYAPIVADPQGGDSLVLYFEFDEGKVSTRSARQLRIIADILRSDPSRKIHINGHADALGTDAYNEKLSDHRAASIREKLIEYGVGGDQIVTKAFGEAMPRRPNYNPDGTDNPGNRSQNRRAEVYLDF